MARYSYGVMSQQGSVKTAERELIMVSSTITRAITPVTATVAEKATTITTATAVKIIASMMAWKEVPCPYVLALDMYSRRAMMLLELALERGAQRGAVVAGAMAQSVVLGDIPLFSVQDQKILMTNTMRAFPDSDIALCWGARVGLSAHASILRALMSPLLLSDVVGVAESFQEIMRLPFRAYHEVRGHEVWFMLDYPLTMRHQPLVRFNVECIFASYVATINSLLACNGRASRVLMPGKSPAYEESYRTYISDRVEFDATDFALVYPASLLLMPVAGSHSVLANHCAHDFYAALRQAQECRNLGPAVSAILVSRIGGYPDFPALAKSLGLGERSLRRRLAEEGVSYQLLLNEVKQQHAQALLDNIFLSVESVAMQLGFSDTANFRRAFRKWTGMTPAQWRQHNDC